MGEAKRRKEMGLVPKSSKTVIKSRFGNLFIRYPILTYILVGVGVIYLIFDLFKYYNR